MHCLLRAHLNYTVWGGGGRGLMQATAVPPGGTTRGKAPSEM